MKREYEVVAYPQIEYLNLFVVDLSYRAPHLHDDLEFALILSGNLCLNTQAEEYRFHAGDAYILNPKDLHELSTDMDSAYILALQLSPKLLRSSFPQDKGFRFSAVSIREHFKNAPRFYPLLQALMTELANCYFSRGPQFQRQCHSLLSMISYLLGRFVPVEPISKERLLIMEQSNYRISKIIDYVEQNFRSKLLLSDIAREQGLSMPYLSRFFKDTLHMTFQEYLNKQRFEYACSLLRATDKNLYEISDLSGFSDVRYLTRLCQRTYGCTPQEYRQKSPHFSKEHQGATLQRICPLYECQELLHSFQAQNRETLSNLSIWDFYHG